MKKSLPVLLVALLMCLPMGVSAQTYTDEQRADLIRTLQQLVVILTQQIQVILAQQQQVLSQQQVVLDRLMPAPQLQPTVPPTNSPSSPTTKPTPYLVLKPRSDYGATFVGGNCSHILFEVSLENGSGDITFINPETKEGTTSPSPATFIYYPQATSTTETVIFRSVADDIEIKQDILLGKSLYESAVSVWGAQAPEHYLINYGTVVKEETIRTGKCV